MSEHQHTDLTLPPARRATRHNGTSALVQHLLATCEREETIIESICCAASKGETATVQTLARDLAALRNGETSRNLPA